MLTTPSEQVAIEWSKKMEMLGYYLAICDDCQGPQLNTEDSAMCFGCGHYSALHLVPDRVVYDLGRDILINSTGEVI